MLSAIGVPETWLGSRSQSDTALPFADRGGMGICRTWSRRSLVPVGDKRGEKRERLLLCQLQTRPWGLYGRRELDNVQMWFLFGQFQRFVRHGGKCGGMDEYGVHRIGCGRHERHESGTEIQCRKRRPLSPEEEVGEGRFVERPGIHDTFRMAFIRISKPTAFVHRFPLCTFCVGDNQ